MPARASVSCATGCKCPGDRYACPLDYSLRRDEGMELSLRKMVLESAGYAVFTAPNAVQGMKTFNAHPIQLVITNHFESASGIAFVAQLRKLKPRLPIIILSGGNIPRHSMTPPDYFLHKLEGPTKLIGKVRSAFRRLNAKPTRAE